ncbi:MAG TPA: PEP-CTERM sorting domain-containing protein [Bryobacteraceae bacterium]|nr:PEP-CTERM sorting domain-containing protein [Bryobacteraceae bacterium]
MRIAAIALIIFGALSYAGSVTYTFESPNFTSGQTTTLLNEAPNSGNIAGFLTTFSAVGNGTDYEIASFDANSLITGQDLYAPTSTNGLIMTFNVPIYAITFDWAIDGGIGSTLTGTIPLVSPIDEAAVAEGTFPGGIFFYDSPTPFSSITLTGVNQSDSATQIAIDNLTLYDSPVPEPSTLFPMALIGLALAAKMGRRPKPTAHSQLP